MEITKSRLKELEKLEAKMIALEGAGVDNWEGYGIAMEKIEEQEEIDSKIDQAVNKALEVLQESAFEPSERGAGFAATEEAQEEVYDILTKVINELRM
jgi:hypothetical protein